LFQLKFQCGSVIRMLTAMVSSFGGEKPTTKYPAVGCICGGKCRLECVLALCDGHVLIERKCIEMDYVQKSKDFDELDREREW